MGFRPSNTAAVFAAFLTSCSASNSMTRLDDVTAACSKGAPHVEVQLRGYVARVLGVRPGASGSHEGFIFVTSGSQLTVEDNVDITGIIPLRRGDAVELQGQYECDDGVIHWTHRDPRGRHITGYIKAHGHTYQ